jgi:dTDP-4-dehydrorhamnose reductase
LKVAVIGAPGQLGQDLMRVFDEDAVGFAHQDLDVTDEARVASAISSAEPDWVLNTAAFHRVDDCELDPTSTFAVNAVGALNVARGGQRRKRRGILLDGLRLRGRGSGA